MDDTLIKIGLALKWMRIASQQSQQKVAAKSGLHRSTVSLIETGRANPSVGTLASLATAIGADLFTLIANAAGVNRGQS